MSNFVESFKQMQAAVHATALSKGWWDSRLQIEKVIRVHDPERLTACRTNNNLALLMLAVGEFGEAAEGLRHGNPPDDKVPEFNALEAECADVIIRVMDLAEARGLRLAEAIQAKAEMNKGRAHMHGGKLA